MSSVALAVCTASDLTSEATTAKPLPASPARAASMVALSASRLVCPAMARISLITSPIFCAACASVAICRLVSCASVTAARTISVVMASWRPISPIEPVNSSAAIAAVSTLVEASLEAATAPSALFEVWPELASSVVAVARMAMAPSRHRVQQVLDPLAEAGDRLLDGRAPLLLLLHRGALALGAAPLGDVLMRRHPAAVGHRPVDDQDDAPVGGFRLPRSWCSPCAIEARSSCRYSSILRAKLPLRDAVFEQAGQRGAGLRHLGRQIVHFQVAPVADHQPLVAVEHAQALRHVVERDPHAPVVGAQPLRQQDQRHRHRHERGEAGGGERNPRLGHSHDGAGRQHDIQQRKGSAKQAPPINATRRQSRGPASAVEALAIRVPDICGHGIPRPVVLQLIAGARRVKKSLTRRRQRWRNCVRLNAGNSSRQ